MSESLREQILRLLQTHAETGSSEFQEDTALAAATGRTVEDVQRQLEALETEGRAWVVRTFGKHQARLN